MITTNRQKVKIDKKAEDIIDDDEKNELLDDMNEYLIDDEYKYSRYYVYITNSTFITLCMLEIIFLAAAYSSNMSIPVEALPYITTLMLNALYGN